VGHRPGERSERLVGRRETAREDGPLEGTGVYPGLAWVKAGDE
jgi:hypothetical protein